MKYGNFKKTLDKYFDDDEEIYPHAWGSCVSFYKLYHGQPAGLIETDSDMESIDFIPKDDPKRLTAR